MSARARVSEVEPVNESNRANLARVDAYFVVDGLDPDEIDWVQGNGLGILHAELDRLRGVVARLEREKR